MQLHSAPDGHLVLPCGRSRGHHLRLWLWLRFRQALRCECRAGVQRFLRGRIRLRVESGPAGMPLLVSESGAGDVLLIALADALRAEGRDAPVP